MVEEGGFLYDSDSYADELPYWVEVGGRDHLVIPYTLDANDMKFLIANGFATAGQFHEYLVDSFEQLYAEGGRMMSVGLHCRIVGKPGPGAGARPLPGARGAARRRVGDDARGDRPALAEHSPCGLEPGCGCTGVRVRLASLPREVRARFADPRE